MPNPARKEFGEKNIFIEETSDEQFGKSSTNGQSSVIVLSKIPEKENVVCENPPN